MHTPRIATTGDLRYHGSPAFGRGVESHLISVLENSRLERDVLPLTGCPL